MKRVAAKFDLRLLTLESKENSLTICQNIKNRSADEIVIKKISVIGNEIWIFGYDLRKMFYSF